MSEAQLPFALAKIEPKPGDVIIFKTDKVLTRDTAFHVRATIRHLIPHIQVIVADGGADVTLMPADELRKRLGEG